MAAENYQRALDIVNGDEFFLEVRNLLMMLIIPKKIHLKDKDQAAFVHATFARVNI